MKNLLEATQMICDLKGSQLALETLVTALVREMPLNRRPDLLQTFETHTEVARTVMLHTPISDFTLAAFERDSARLAALIAAAPPARVLVDAGPTPTV